MLHGLQSGCKERFPRIMVSSYFPRGSTMTRKGESSLPFLLSRIGLAISVPVLPISDAVHCNRSCSALQPSPQCTASVLAVHCILHANICNRPRRYLREKHHVGKVRIHFGQDILRGTGDPSTLPLDEYSCISSHTLLCAHKSETLGGGGLDAHIIGIHAHHTSQTLLHGRNVRA